MLIFQILMAILAAAVLFLLFLPTAFEFVFASNFWEFRIKNLFFKRCFGSNSKKKEDLPKTKDEKETKITPKISSQEEKITEKEFSDNFKVPKKIEKEEIPEFEEEEETNKKSFTDWIVLAKETWSKEKKLVKSVSKFVLKTVKLSLKLLTPAKVEINACGGFDEPAETGWLCSVFILLNSQFEGNKRISLIFTPQFYEPKWNFDGKIAYSISIAKLLLFVILILLYIPYLQIVKWYLRKRKT